MHAIEVTELGGPEVLRRVDAPMRSPGPGGVLIKAEAIGVNWGPQNGPVGRTNSH